MNHDDNERKHDPDHSDPSPVPAACGAPHPVTIPMFPDAVRHLREHDELGDFIGHFDGYDAWWFTSTRSGSHFIFTVYRNAFGSVELRVVSPHTPQVIQDIKTTYEKLSS